MNTFIQITVEIVTADGRTLQSQQYSKECVHIDNTEKFYSYCIAIVSSVIRMIGGK